ncbi:hypothetical protein [Bacillus niameyensis]|nr:hypothetical protein [Bacillus niameyensis]
MMDHPGIKDDLDGGMRDEMVRQSIIQKFDKRINFIIAFWKKTIRSI